MTDIPNVDEPLPFTARIPWPHDAMVNPVVVNVSAVSPSAVGMDGELDGSLYLLFGHVGFPVFSGPDEAASFFNGGGPLSLTVHGSYFLQKAKAEELWRALGVALGHLPNISEFDGPL